MARSRRRAHVTPGLVGDSPSASPVTPRSPWNARAVALALVLLALNAFVYAQVRGYDFVNLDDAQYVTDNPEVAEGLTRGTVLWAFTARRAGNWHPLTWLSHMLDVSLFGMNPGAHHATSAWLHAVNALLLFGLLVRLTGALFRSAFVAALFAVHPLHVESVAWVAERKDVLSTCFGILALLSYVAYTRRPGAGRLTMVGLLFALSLMAKPMLVTLPLVMMLLDFWPLGRFEPRPDTDGTVSMGRSIAEKLPLLALSLAASVIAFAAQQQAGAVRSFEALPAGYRVENAAMSYVAYLGQMVWPVNLSALYPYPLAFPAWQITASACLLLFISFLATKVARRHPCVFVGWFWYLVTLLPVIGLIQVGSQSRADRYTYFPLIGPFVILAWGVPEVLGRGRLRDVASGTAALLSVAACALLSREQAGYWRNSTDLWEHAIRVSAENPRAHHNLGHALAKRGDLERAVAEYTEALRLKPGSAETHNNLGEALVEMGRGRDARPHYEEALRIAPEYAEAHNNLGILLHGLGENDQAIGHLTEAVRLMPALPAPHNNLGAALLGLGRAPEAAAHFSEALRIEPGYADARANLARAENALGVASVEAGKVDEAIGHWRKASGLAPELVEARVNLGRTLADQGRTDEAIRELTEALRTAPNQADFHYDLAVLLNRQGRAGDALAELDAALRLDPDHRPAREARDALRRR